MPGCGRSAVCPASICLLSFAVRRATSRRLTSHSPAMRSLLSSASAHRCRDHVRIEFIIDVCKRARKILYDDKHSVQRRGRGRRRRQTPVEGRTLSVAQLHKFHGSRGGGGQGATQEQRGVVGEASAHDRRTPPGADTPRGGPSIAWRPHLTSAAVAAGVEAAAAVGAAASGMVATAAPA